METAEIIDLGLHQLVDLDARVDQAEGEGIYARWEFGRALLSERGDKKQLPPGRLDEVANATGKSRAELGHRMRFADRYRTEGEVANAVRNFASWHSIVNEDLASTAHLSSAKDEWATPQELFDALHTEFQFTLDVCAVPGNAKCERYFSQDGLELDWGKETCWMNPPYSEIDAWMDKAANSGTTVVCLVPSRTDVGWFWNHARSGEIRFIKGRLHFVDDEGNTGPAPFPSCLVVFGRPPGFSWPPTPRRSSLAASTRTPHTNSSATNSGSPAERKNAQIGRDSLRDCQPCGIANAVTPRVTPNVTSAWADRANLANSGNPVETERLDQAVTQQVTVGHDSWSHAVTPDTQPPPTGEEAGFPRP